MSETIGLIGFLLAFGMISGMSGGWIIASSLKKVAKEWKPIFEKLVGEDTIEIKILSGKECYCG